MLFFANQVAFATGAATYAYRPASDRETSPRVILPILIEDFQTTGFVDTGGSYILFAPDVAEQIGLRPADALEVSHVLFRRFTLTGAIHRVNLTLLADPDKGDRLTVEATAFVPQLAPDQEWPNELPCVLGMLGCLERLRFAVDPTDDTFYFGEIG